LQPITVSWISRNWNTHRINRSVVQLLPHADHIIVLNEDRRITEKGSFDDLNSSDGFISALGLKKVVVKEIEAVVVQEEENEKTEKQIVLENIAMIQAMPKSDEKKRSRGRRNSRALFSYIRSMGKVYFPIFCAFTVCNIGFRSAQRKL
jgi:ATP-binding cassette subfamily C (CFTR/MRP) protein 1